MESEKLSLLLQELDGMPRQLKLLVQRFCESKLSWKPSDWTGMPSESFSAIEQTCHLRDIEIDGYQERFRKTVNENEPVLHSIDGYRLAEERQYQLQDSEVVLEQFSKARQQTVELIRGFSVYDLDRKCVFENAGEITLTSLIYFLISHDQQHLSGLNWLLAKIEAQNRTENNRVSAKKY